MILKVKQELAEESIQVYKTNAEDVKKVSYYNNGTQITLTKTEDTWTPFMIVAGDHATNDMAGEEEDSWKNQFEAAGYTVECHLKGLGEYEGIRKIFLKHIEESK